MLNFFLCLARFSITVWFGAAVMFVVLTVAEILSGQFNSIVLDQLILTRFPIYYLFTFVLLATSWISGVFYWRLSALRRAKLFTILVSISLIILISDYIWVYKPLEDMLTPAGSARSQEFPFYHKLTEALNTVAMLINLTASIVINRTIKKIPAKN
ncbi:MAG: hypothetical protein JKY95_02825 [Planctomycetaceae bacterium]|nr:hypothetical protein [Planctomycetaceae bacterium]